MSDLTNRAAYLKGLADGMKLDKETNEGRLLSEILDFLTDVADEIDAIDQEQGFIADKIDDIEDDIDVIADELFCDEYDDYDEDDEFQITCEACGEEIILSSEDLLDGEIYCPNCGEVIEFEFDCDGDCGVCGGCGDDEE